MLEKAIISGVTHTHRGDGLPVDGRARPRSSRRWRTRRSTSTPSCRPARRSCSRHRPTTAPTAERALDAARRAWSAREDLGKVSIIGAGMQSHPGIAAKTFATLGGLGIAPEIITTSPIKIACYVGPTTSSARSGAARRVRARAAGSGARPCLESAWSAPPAPSAGCCSASSASAASTTCALFASARSAGRELDGRIVEEATPEALAAADVDVCFFAVGPTASRELVPHAVRSGAVVLDKSSAWRMEPGVPLVVPEVNPDRALEHEGIIAVPNCSTIPLTCVLEPLHAEAGLARVRVATYQSVSGAGLQRMEDLRAEARRSTTCGWTGTSTARSTTRRRRSATRRGRSWSCRNCPQRHLRTRADPRRPLGGGLDRDRAAAIGRARARPSGGSARPASGGRAQPGAGGGHRRRPGRPHPARSLDRRERAFAVPLRRQPAQRARP